MPSLLTHSDIEDLVLNVCGSNKIRYWKNDKIQICCPIHSETHPSCSINAHWIPDDSSEVLQVFVCFACGKSGTLQKLLYFSRPDLFKNELEAMRYIEGRYNISFDHKVYEDTLKIKRYEELYLKDELKEFEVKPFYSLAPFKSGKETFNYFFQRGFTKDELKEYMIGRDLNLKTITIPVFYENGELAGIIGRKLPKFCKEYEQRYHIYDFPKGKFLYPLDKVVVTNGEVILIESQLDAILMRRWGYENVLATMGGTVTKYQADLVANMCNSVILLFDNDKGGKLAEEKAERLLKGRIRLKKCSYFAPELGKDPSDWGKELTHKILSTAGICNIKRI